MMIAGNGHAGEQSEETFYLNLLRSALLFPVAEKVTKKSLARPLVDLKISRYPQSRELALLKHTARSNWKLPLRL